MVAGNLSARLRTPRQFIEWLVLCFFLPGIPFGMIWGVLNILNSTGVLDSKILTTSVFIRPDLVFFATTATVTTFIDLANTTDAFRRQGLYHVVYFALFIAYGWTTAVYGVSLAFEILNEFDPSSWIDLLTWSALIPFLLTFCFQIFSISYTTN